MKRLMAGLATLLAVPLISLAQTQTPAQAALGPADFIKADGKYLKRNSGTGDIVTLRGTNLGGWLTFEDWMSPLGEFALDRTGWSATASHSSATAGNALDGSDTSRWTPGINQAGGQWFQVDLGSQTLFNRAYLNASGFTGTFPAGYRIEVSADATTWKNVASGTGSAQNTVVTFSPQVARHVRVTLTASAGAWWSLAEFHLFSRPVMHNGAHTASASLNGGSAALALDGDVNTRWTSGAAQAPGQTFTVDLGSVKPVNQVLMDAGPDSAGDYPRGYEILGSQDGTNWSKVGSEYGGSRILVEDFFTTAYLRYLRIGQTATSGSWWSIAEIAIYAANEGAFDRTGWAVTASATEPGGSTANVKDGNASTRWSTGAPQASGQWLRVDMGATMTFNQIVLDTAKNSTDENDYPRGYAVEVSMDGSTWTQVATGAGGRKATPINFAATRGRYFRITLTASSGSWWSAGELDVRLNNDDYSMNLAYQKRFGAATTESIISTHQNTWVQESDLDNIAAMGMNVIRLPIGWTELLNLDGTWKTDPWSKIDWLIGEASARNIYVLIDLHTVPGGGCPWGSCGRVGPNPNAFWTTSTYQDWVVTIWQAIANRYEGNPAVAGYDLINEPLIDYGEDTDDVNQKSLYYDRLYDAVRAIDPDHTIFFAAFFGWNTIAKPAVHGWTNVAYELHPYDFPGGKDWDAQHNNVVQTQLNDVGAKQNDPTWNVPVLYGEYALYHFDDVWAKFMSGLNAQHVSWTNWNYKVRADHYNGAGGYWGFYNSNPNQVPVINGDTTSTITTKLGGFATASFQPNQSFIDVVKRFAGGQQWLATIPLDQTGWVATASSTEAGSSAANALDWNPATRWSTGAPQAGGQWFQVNMGKPAVIDQISFETRSNERWDFPRGYQIQVSLDGTNWTTVRTGKGWGWKQALPFAPIYAQYVRVNQTGTGPDWWSMAEFHVFGEPALNRGAWTATASSGASTGNAFDGSFATRWTSGAPQASGQFFQVDLGANQTFNRLVLDSSTSTSDYPRGFEVQVSTNGSAWTTVASGSGSGPSVLVTFPVQVARHVKVVLTAGSASWWSIHDMNIYGERERSRTGWTATASSTEGGGSPANALDGAIATRWSSGAPQASGQWYKVDMGSSQWFNHVVLDAGASASDYPRDYVVEVSNDNIGWSIVANGEGNSAVTTVNFPITQARYLRVTLKKGSASWFSIAEIRVYE